MQNYGKDNLGETRYYELDTRMTSHKDLIVWQKSIELVIEIYRITSKFPRSELFGIVMQMRKAVISIPSNDLQFSLIYLVSSS